RTGSCPGAATRAARPPTRRGCASTTRPTRRASTCTARPSPPTGSPGAGAPPGRCPPGATRASASTPAAAPNRRPRRSSTTSASPPASNPTPTPTPTPTPCRRELSCYPGTPEQLSSRRSGRGAEAAAGLLELDGDDDAAVLGAALVGAVVGAGVGEAVAGGGDEAGVQAAALDEPRGHGLGATLGEVEVVLLGADVVGVPLDEDGDGGAAVRDVRDDRLE